MWQCRNTMRFFIRTIHEMARIWLADIRAANNAIDVADDDDDDYYIVIKIVVIIISLMIVIIEYIHIYMCTYLSVSRG